MNCILQTQNLCKKYLTNNSLVDINVQIESGKIIGLVGPDGSGKTTFLKIVAGFIRQSSGEIQIDGHKPGTYTKSIVSYLPDINYMHKWMTIKEVIKFFMDFYEDFQKDKAYELLQFMKLDENIKISELSKDFLEKLKLTLVLARQARLYLLDEPFNGTDSQSRDEIINLILKSYDKSSAIIIASSLIGDFERLIDEVIVFSKGKVVLKGKSEELRSVTGKSIDDLYKEVL